MLQSNQYASYRPVIAFGVTGLNSEGTGLLKPVMGFTDQIKLKDDIQGKVRVST
jgi:hypothetical protein